MLKKNEAATVLEFNGVVDPKGRIAVPRRYLKELPRRGLLHVRLMRKRLQETLQARGVTEEEIDRIAAVQLEPRERVVSFLLSEGAFDGRRRTFAARTGKRS